jgi:peptide/nickel transport system substrate-binding protein
MEMKGRPWRGLHRLSSAAVILAAALTFAGAATAEPHRGGVLKMVITPEPPRLLAAVSSTAVVQQVSSKMHDGLLAYDEHFDPQPSLATAWEVSPDGLTIRFDLRKDVKWHDGVPFTSEDVKFTIMKVLKVHHPRGRSTFAHVTDVETPDPHTAILKLNTPSPYIMQALHVSESPMIPKHVYENGDPTQNEHVNAPIGTGPFVFKEWKKGSYLILERNPNYWEKGKPYLDRIVYNFIPDASARSIAFETGEIDAGGPFVVPMNDLDRLQKMPHLALTEGGYAMFGGMHYLEFNMEDPQFKDVRVRKAFAYAINKDFIINNVWFGHAGAATGPISPQVVQFYSADVPSYPYDPKKAEKLLDEAGFPRKAGGVRFKVTLDPVPFAERYGRAGEYIKQALRQVGIDVVLRSTDAPTWLRRIYTDRSFQVSNYDIYNMSDPTIGVQRMYWSKAHKKGVVFSNGSGYSNPEMDRTLEAAQVEVDPVKRKKLFADMQRLAMEDLPIIPILYNKYVTVYNKRAHGLDAGIDGLFGTFADVYVDSE